MSVDPDHLYQDDKGDGYHLPPLPGPEVCAWCGDVGWVRRMDYVNVCVTCPGCGSGMDPPAYAYVRPVAGELPLDVEDVIPPPDPTE
jgi:hypothetical protein